MVTVAVPGFPRETPVGNDDGMIVMSKSSLRSNILSWNIEMLNETVITPAGITTVYFPGS